MSRANSIRNSAREGSVALRECGRLGRHGINITILLINICASLMVAL